MANPTTNFGWVMPTSTDLVTDLPADFAVFGQGVDTTLADLKGGTTGQVLKKNSDTDMDFVWSADSAGMTNPMTTTGDTIYSSSGSTPARLGIGSSGQILTVSGGLPTWQTPAAGGGFTQIATGTLSGTSVNLSSIAGTYKNLRLVLSNYYMSGGSCNMQMTFNGVTSASYVTAGSQGVYSGAGFNWNAYSATGWNSTYAWLGNGTNVYDAASNNQYIIDIPNYAATTNYKIANGTVYARSTTSAYAFQAEWHLFKSSSAITQITISPESGYNFGGGTYTLLGQS